MLALLATGASAATQGTLGSTSTGSVSINASVPNRIQLTGLTDVSFLNQDPAVAAASTQNVCVWSNTSTKGHFVTATGSGTARASTLANGALTVPYRVDWAGASVIVKISTANLQAMQAATTYTGTLTLVVAPE